MYVLLHSFLTFNIFGYTAFINVKIVYGVHDILVPPFRSRRFGPLVSVPMPFRILAFSVPCHFLSAPHYFFDSKPPHKILFSYVFSKCSLDSMAMRVNILFNYLTWTFNNKICMIHLFKALKLLVALI